MNEELKIFIKAEIADLKKNLGEAQKEVKETAKEGQSGFKKFGEAAKTAGKVVATGLAAAGAAIAAAAGALMGLAESTKEYRTAQAKLQTAFETAGSSAEQAKQTYSDLYRVLGDEDKSTEAAANLAMLTQNEKDLAEWATICQGAYATFGESLPIEALAEAANETAKTGALTGALADALNWADTSNMDFGIGLKDNIEFIKKTDEELAQMTISQRAAYEEQKKHYEENQPAIDEYNKKIQEAASAEERFQIALDACNTEAEREALIRGTLSTIYGEAAAGYEENAAALIAENEAQAALTESLANLGAIAAPIMTLLKQTAADLLETITPFVSLIAEGLVGAFNGTAGASEKLAEGLSGLLDTLLNGAQELLPTIIQLVVDLFPKLITTIVQALPSVIKTVVKGATDVLQAIAKMLPELIPLMIDAVILIVETLIDNIDLIIDAGIELILGLADGLIEAIPRLIDKIPTIINKLVIAIGNNLPKIHAAGIELLVKLGAGIVVAIPKLVGNIPKVWAAMLGGFMTSFKNIKSVGKDLIKGLWNGIKDMGSWISDKLKGFGDDVLGSIKGFFGIKSPSRVMRDQVGKYLAEGIGVGFMDEMASVNKDIEKSITPLTEARSFSVHGSFAGLSPLAATGGNFAPIATNNKAIDGLVSSMQGDNRPLILKVGEKVFAETTFNAWNNYVKQTGSCPVKVW